MSNGHGGKRTNAGKKKGTKWASTLKKEAARELVRQAVTAELGEMVRAQIAQAKGIQHFFLRDPVSRQFTRITDPDEIERALNSGGKQGEFFWVFTKDPSIQAFTDLANRAIDKPAEHLNVSGEDGGPIEVRWKE